MNKLNRHSLITPLAGLTILSLSLGLVACDPRTTKTVTEVGGSASDPLNPVNPANTSKASPSPSATPSATPSPALTPSPSPEVLLENPSGQILARDPKTLEPLWRYTNYSEINHGPTLLEGIVLAQVDGSFLLALEALTGEVRFRIFFAGGVQFRPVVCGKKEVLLVVDQEGYLIALNKKTGSRLWKHDWRRVHRFKPLCIGERAIVIAENGWVEGLTLGQGRSAWYFNYGRELAATPIAIDDENLEVILPGDDDSDLRRTADGGFLRKKQKR